ncbi:MAG: hypothetical protein ABR964_15480, partial [Tepidisphaeraceae bacterium]
AAHAPIELFTFPSPATASIIALGNARAFPSHSPANAVPDSIVLRTAAKWKLIFDQLPGPLPLKTGR